MVFWDKWSNVYILGNPVPALFEAFLIFLTVLLAIWIFKRYILHILNKTAERTKTNLDNIFIGTLNAISWPFYSIVAIFVAGKYLTLSPIVDKVLDFFFLVGATYYGVKAISAGVLYVGNSYYRKRKGEDAALPRLFAGLIALILWIVAFLFVLSNLGIEIGPLIAGLGIGGIAVAFALQGVLEDLFAAFSIYFDKPFEVGDFIIVGADMGTVTKIGLKSTRLQTLQGQELILSNKELTSTRVNNYKRMQRRRVVFSFGVQIGTKASKLKQINGIVKAAIEKHVRTTFDRSHFKEFGDSSLKYEVVYYVEEPDYTLYMDIQQAINLEIVEQFEKLKIAIAFPTRTVHVITDKEPVRRS